MQVLLYVFSQALRLEQESHSGLGVLVSNVWYAFRWNSKRLDPGLPSGEGVPWNCRHGEKFGGSDLSLHEEFFWASFSCTTTS